MPRASSLRGRVYITGHPAHHHLAGYAFLHSATSSILTRPSRTSPLGCARLHHLDAPRVASRLVTSSPLGRPVRRHQVGHLITTRPPRALPLGWSPHHHSAAPCVATKVGHLITTRPSRASPLGWSPHHHSAAPRAFRQLSHFTFCYFRLPEYSIIHTSRSLGGHATKCTSTLGCLFSHTCLVLVM